MELGGNVTVFEHYSFRGKKPGIKNQIGSWSENGGFHIPISDVWDRRKDLGGVELSDVMVYTEPLLIPPVSESEPPTGTLNIKVIV